MFEFVDKVGEKFIEKFFLSLISPFNVEDLDEAVKRNVSLIDETQKYNPRSLAMAERMAKQFGGQKQHLTTDNVLKWISDKRPDLYFSIISDYRKRRWLDINIKEFREYLFF